jgi:glycosyltransferase involved in cell wall biosynthesis
MAQLARALTIAHVDAERGFSGGEVQVFLLMEGLARLGHQCVLFCPPASRSAEIARERRLEHVEVRMRHDLDLAAARRLAREFRKLRPDLVHLHTGRAAWLGGWGARLAGIPAISTRRMDRPLRQGFKTRWIYGKLTSRVAAISPSVAESLREGGVDPRRIVVIPSAIDRSRVAPVRGREAVRAELGIGESESLLLAVGALVRRKGFDVLLDALQQVTRAPGSPSVRLVVAGEGPERSALQDQIRSLGLEASARLLGARTGVAELLAGCDVFVMPSRQEGLGIAALEALAASRPIVASRVGGLGEVLVHEQCALLVPPEDPGALAQGLLRLLGDGELRARLAAAGPQRLREGYLPEQMSASYDKLYAEVLAELRNQAAPPGL